MATETMKRRYYHIKGTNLSRDQVSITGDPNYVMATLYYRSGSGFYEILRPVHKYMLEGVEMVAASYFLSKDNPGSERPLIKCRRRSSKAEEKALSMFESGVIADINRLGYEIDAA